VLATGVPPRVIVDATNFKNESASRLSTNMIVDRLRNELIRSAHAGCASCHARTRVQKTSAYCAERRAGQRYGWPARWRRLQAGRPITETIRPALG
jgi:hypothetical protein